MKKNKIIIIVLIVIICVLVGFLIFKYDRGKYAYDTETGERIEPVEINNFSHIIIKGTIFNTTTHYTKIFTFDENDEIINIRLIREYATEEEAQEAYNEFLKMANRYGKPLKGSISGTTVIETESHSSDITRDRILEMYKEPNGTTVTEVYIY